MPMSEPTKSNRPSPAASKGEGTGESSNPPPWSAPQDELDTLIRARYPVIYVVSWEEERVERRLLEISKQRKKAFYTWSCTQGLHKYGAGDAAVRRQADRKTCDPVAALDSVIGEVEPAVYLFKDMHRHLLLPPEGCPGNINNVRRVREASALLRDTYKTLVIVGPVLRLPTELQKDVTVVEFDLPRVPEIGRLLDNILEDVKSNPRLKVDLDSEGKERLLHAARGLTLREAENVFAKTLVIDGRLDADDVKHVYGEKQQIIRKGGLLEYCEPDVDLRHVAGLDNLKDWLAKRQEAFSQRAVDFGLPAPKGMLLLGVQGCGKSLCAKATASFWKLPLLRFDMGRMFGSYVGSSEENVRQAIQTAEGVAPCVLWTDEIDKAFSGAANSGGSDGGTAARVFGTFLTWLSEKKSPVFVVATANNISQLPPELLRKGRLDDIFFVDLPNQEEREAILRVHLELRGRDPDKFRLAKLASLADGFSGAEIEEAIVAGLFDVFSGGGELNDQVIAKAIKETVPLSKTMGEDLDRLRHWSRGRARPASRLAVAEEAGEIRRKIEF
jgi:AAA+ superfamily predicted ATPase